MAAKIGIKLADGTFFPIMDDDFSASETLELTTVRNDQRSVQINLFRKEHETAEPAYIGSLIVEDIHERTAGDPTIELRLSLDEQKNLSAEAVYKDSGSHQALRVSLENLSDQSLGNLDFDLNAETGEADIDLTAGQPIDTDTLDDQHSFSVASFYTDDEPADEPEKKRSFPIWLLVLLILLGVAALVLGILLLTKKNLAEDDQPITVQPSQAFVVPSEPVKQEPVPELQKTAPALPAESRAVEPPTPAPEQPADVPSEPQQNESADPGTTSDSVAKNTQPQEPASDAAASMSNNADMQKTAGETATQGAQKAQTAEAPQTASAATAAALGQAVTYKLRWGDTLWDIAETYYRNPWLYTKIAEHNKLKNPDWVMSGTTIEIPPQ